MSVEYTDDQGEFARQAELMSEIDRLEEMAMLSGDPAIRELIVKKQAQLASARPPARPDIR